MPWTYQGGNQTFSSGGARRRRGRVRDDEKRDAEGVEGVENGEGYFPSPTD